MVKWSSLEGSNGNGSLDDGSKVSYPIRLSIDVSCDYPIAATPEVHSPVYDFILRVLSKDQDFCKYATNILGKICGFYLF